MKHNRRIYKTHFYVLLLILSIMSSAHEKPIREFHVDGLAQGTTYHITYFAKDSIVRKSDIDKIFASLDSSLSIYKPYSIISRFNKSEKGITVDKHLQKVVKRSIEIYNDTEGRFDITVYPLVNAWGFGNTKQKILPDSAKIKSLLDCVGSSKIKLNGYQLSKSKSCVQIDVNGIAQGYSADILAGWIEKKGIKNYLVEIGGEIRVSGRKPDGSFMRIGIESPPKDHFDETIIRKVIRMERGAVTTSGSYRKYIESGSKKLSHLIDPATGFPITTDMVSVTVIARDGITADGYDNPLMAMDIKTALEFATKRSLDAYFIYHKSTGELSDTATAGFYKLLSK